jgi:hypothetical protein
LAYPEFQENSLTEVRACRVDSFQIGSKNNSGLFISIKSVKNLHSFLFNIEVINMDQALSARFIIDQIFLTATSIFVF